MNSYGKQRGQDSLFSSIPNRLALVRTQMAAGDDAARGNDRLGVRRARGFVSDAVEAAPRRHGIPRQEPGSEETAGRESTGGARCRKEGPVRAAR